MSTGEKQLWLDLALAWRKLGRDFGGEIHRIARSAMREAALEWRKL